MKGEIMRLIAYMIVIAILGILSGIYFGCAFLVFKWMSH